MSLEKWSYVAAITAIPVAFLVWLIRPEPFRDFVKKRWKLIASLCFCAGVCWLIADGRFKWLAISVTVPLWLLLGSLAALLAINYAIGWLKGIASQPIEATIFGPEHDWTKFRSGLIFGVIWRWDYFAGGIARNSLNAFCPREGCGNRLRFEFDTENPHLQHTYSAMPMTHLCKRCGFKHYYDCIEDIVIQNTMDEIERLITTGQFTKLM